MINIDGININYIECGTGPNIILVHGWLASHKYFNKLINKLSKSYKVYAIDLPGFGESNIPPIVYNTHNYANILKEFITKLNIDNPTLIGHSYGGKVIIDLVTETNIKVNKIVLISTPGIKAKKTIKQKLNTYKYKILKKYINITYKNEEKNIKKNKLQEKYGSYDYNHSKGIMKDILVTVVNEDYTPNLPKIKVPTLLIYGEYDTATPIKCAKKMNSLITNSGLVIINNSNHFPFITHLDKCYLIIDTFLKSK